MLFSCTFHATHALNTKINSNGNKINTYCNVPDFAQLRFPAKKTTPNKNTQFECSMDFCYSGFYQHRKNWFTLTDPRVSNTFASETVCRFIRNWSSVCTIKSAHFVFIWILLLKSHCKCNTIRFVRRNQTLFEPSKLYIFSRWPGLVHNIFFHRLTINYY